MPEEVEKNVPDELPAQDGNLPEDHEEEVLTDTNQGTEVSSEEEQVETEPLEAQLAHESASLGQVEQERDHWKNLFEELASSTETKIALLSSEVEALSKKPDSETSDPAYTEELETIRGSHEGALTRLTADHELELDELEKKHKQELQGVSEEYNLVLHRLTEQEQNHQSEINRLKDFYEENLRVQQEEQESSLASMSDERLLAFKADADARVEAAETNARREIEAAYAEARSMSTSSSSTYVGKRSRGEAHASEVASTNSVPSHVKELKLHFPSKTHTVKLTDEHEVPEEDHSVFADPDPNWDPELDTLKAAPDGPQENLDAPDEFSTLLDPETNKKEGSEEAKGGWLRRKKKTS